MGKLSDYIGLTGEAVTLVDTPDQFAVDTAEAALQELASQVDTLQSGSSGGGLAVVGSLTKTVGVSETNSILLSEVAPDPVVTVVKEIPQTGFTNQDWTIETADADFDVEAANPGVFEDGKFIAGVSEQLDTKVAVTNATGQIDSSNMTNINSITPVEADVVAGGFNTVTYTGNGTSNQITGVGFQPDLIWIKSRTGANSHQLVDSVRGFNNVLVPNDTSGEGANPTVTQTSDGFNLISSITMNYNTYDYVSWCWKAGGPAVANTDGTITSQVSANQELGFSIVSYTGTGVTGNIGHGLGKAPKFIIVKKRTTNGGDGNRPWVVFHKDVGPHNSLQLNDSMAQFNAIDQWGSTTPDSSVFYVGSGVGYQETNYASDTYIAYCFAEIPGFSKFGSYEGNGSADGPEIDLGFKPEFVMIKAYDRATSWLIFDSTRGMASGENDPYVLADGSGAEGILYNLIDKTPTGFKMVLNNMNTNSAGYKYIYMAFGKKVEAKGAKVFDTVKYTGDDTTSHKIQCGFQPDLVWIKARDLVSSHVLMDSVRGVGKHIKPESSLPEDAGGLSSFDTDGFVMDQSGQTFNSSLYDYVAWCWKKDPSAGLDIVSYTGDGVAGRTVAHNLGKKPAMIIVKNLDRAGQWHVYHKSLGPIYSLFLDLNDAGTVSNDWNDVEPTSTEFTVKGGATVDVNATDENIIAYVFAEIPGFSKFGSYIGNGSTNGPEINCGFKPSFLMIKHVDGIDGWNIVDTERGGKSRVYADLSNAEDQTGNISITDTGFKVETGSDSDVNTSGDKYIYMAFGDTLPAISEPRGFSAQTYVGDSVNGHEITEIGFQPDLVWIKNRDDADDHMLFDSVRGKDGGGVNYWDLRPNSSVGHASSADGALTSLNSDGFTLTTGQRVNWNGHKYVSWAWKKSPETGLDIVQYTGDGIAGRTVAHNLGEKPAFILVKNLDTAGYSWLVYHKSIGANKYLELNNSVGSALDETSWNNTKPTTTNFTLGSSNWGNGLNKSFIAYIFSEIKGYSKFGSYMGNGSTTGPVINCGFRPAFVMLKRTDGAGDWLMFDGIRGIGSGNDSLLWSNLSSSEDAVGDRITVHDSGFSLTNIGGAYNSSGGNYIFIAFGGNVPAQPTKNTNYALSTDGRTTWQVVQNEKGFEAVTYTGDNTYSRDVYNVGFSPDLVWIKNRIDPSDNILSDSLRSGLLISNSSASEGGTAITSYNSDGFTMRLVTQDFNGNSDDDYVAWCWKAGGPAVANTDGTIPTQVSANQDLGFSIVKYTGNATAGATIGHGLGTKPDLVIIKNLATTNHWIVYHNSLGASNALILNLDSGSSGTGLFNVTEPDSSAITLGGNVDVNGPQELVAYAWSSKPGFSSFGSYTGNGSTDGPEINCGFEPAFVMIKDTTQAGNWNMYDASRINASGVEGELYANQSAAEGFVNDNVEFNATGFKLIRNTGSTNTLNDNYIYIAFAKSVPQSLRNIVRDNAGTWEINTNPAGETWTPTTSNNQEDALKEAFTYTFNQMSGDAIKSAGSLLPTPGSTLDMAMEASDSKSIESISFNYDANAMYEYLSLGTDYTVEQPDTTHLEVTSNIAANIIVKARK